MTELSNEQLQRRRLSRQRFAWIERILLDPSISHLQFRVAILINNKYLNGTSGDAWPSQEQLAADLGLALRTIQYALDALVDAGLLHRDVARGRSLHNRYRPIFETENLQDGDVKGAPLCTFSDPKTCTVAPENVHGDDNKTCTAIRTNLSKRTLLSNQERESTRPPIGKKEQTGWPEGFKLTPNLIAYAEQKNYGQCKAIDMFNEFRNSSLANGKTFANWEFGWRSWVDKEIKFKPSEPDRNRIDDRL